MVLEYNLLFILLCLGLVLGVVASSGAQSPQDAGIETEPHAWKFFATVHYTNSLASGSILYSSNKLTSFL